MKKMIALLLVVCVMCSMLIVTASAAEPRSMMRVETVTKRAANVRKYPNTNSLVYGNLMKGETWNTTTFVAGNDIIIMGNIKVLK